MSLGSALRMTAPRGAAPLGLMLAAVAVAAKLTTLLAISVGYRTTFCLFKLTTGCPCMTCGATRALNRLLAMDLGGAFVMNPLATLAALVVVPWALADTVLLLRGRALSMQASEAVASVLRPLVLVAVFVNWGYLVAVGR